MKGLLIYTSNEAERNRFAIQKFKENLDLKLVLADEQIDFNQPCDFVINRTNDCNIALEFEKRSIRVFNNSRLSRIANDKEKCYELVQSAGIEIMQTPYDAFPKIVKSKSGKGGNEVFLVHSESEMPKLDKPFLTQQVCDTPGVDLRVYVIGGKIVFSAMRKAKSGFKANFCLNGEAKIHTLTAEEKTLCEKIISLLDIDYAGIDFIYHSGRPVFNEIEDSVGARMVYSLSDYDIIKDYCDYIRSRL